MPWSSVLVLMVLLSSCATVGRESLNNRGDDWPPLDMTESQLITELGSPKTSVLSMIDGTSTKSLTWVYAHVEPHPALFIPVVGLFVAASGDGMSGSSRSLTVTFNPEGKIVRRAWAQHQIGKDHGERSRQPPQPDN